ncbi:hypothetical protein DXA08_11430 [Blautia obeum]|nr:hypothetical protein DXA08_11430 [Blautia obeum]
MKKTNNLTKTVILILNLFFFGKSYTRKGKITVPNQRRPDQYKKYVEHIAVQFYRSLYLREVFK